MSTAKKYTIHSPSIDTVTLLYIQQCPSVLEAAMVCSSRSWSFTMLWRSYRKLLYGGGGNGVQKCIQLSNRCYIRTLHLKRLYFQKQVKEEHQTWNSNCEGSAVSNKCPAHFWPFIHTVQAHPIIPRGGLTGSRTGCNLKTG